MDLETPPGPPRALPVLQALVVFLILSLLVGIAIPRVEQLQARRVASEAFLDMSSIRSAASAYLQARGEWPATIVADAGPGALAPYLPPGFSFRSEQYELSWEHWPLPVGLPPGGDSVSLIAVLVRTPLERVPRELLRVLGPGVGRFTLGETTTFILEGL
ncbi:MAG: hypothetical protein EXR92_07420 [Gemmatimonadetes bacterium]|nr:hypothetical protein [Gemmatimonadota bacterium]